MIKQGTVWDELAGVFVRTPIGNVTLAADSFAPEDRHYAEYEWSAALYGWLNAQSCPIVNPPAPGRSATMRVSHPILRSALTQAGFAHCDQVVLTQKERVLEQYDRWNRHVRLHALSPSGRPLYVHGVEGVNVLQALGPGEPVVMQPVPEGQRLHVFVVGQTVIGGRWRTAVQNAVLRERVLDAVTVFPHVAQQCRQVTRALGVLFAEFELVQGRDEQIYCMGVSDSPLYDQCSDVLRESIVRSLASLCGVPVGQVTQQVRYA
ncbi:MAG: hypothetical protein U0172_05225 [Nitrospiraceae bacterium]